MPSPAAPLPSPPASAIHVTAVPGPKIRLNTLGFLPGAEKQATVAASCSDFEVIDLASGHTIYTAKAEAPFVTPATDTQETVQTLDFSKVQAPGHYILRVPGIGDSNTFSIATNIWNQPYEVTARAMYLWRCGTAVETTWNGVTFKHDACHLDDGYLDYVGGGHQKAKSIGGWHDAGDYNKYVVNAGVSVGFLLKALEHFPTRIEKVSLGIPESSDAVPDLLNEVRWEVEWLLTMQMEDGRVYHKLSAKDFKFWGVPQEDGAERFFSPWSSTATADFVAMLAETSRHWKKYDATFADRCLAAARKSWSFLAAHPEDTPADLSEFKTGGYGAKDFSGRLWASAELWETTGEEIYLKDFEVRAANFSVSQLGPRWGDVRDLGIATYLLSNHPTDRNPALVARFTAETIKQAQTIVRTSQENGYKRPLGVDRRSWSWGGNGVVAGQTFILHLADKLQPDAAYRVTAQRALDYLFGRNYHGRSYVTGLGGNPPRHPHDRRGEPAWPGYLVGGPWPDARSWEDKRENYRVNEIAINWNTALVYALAAFVEPTQPHGGSEKLTVN